MGLERLVQKREIWIYHVGLGVPGAVGRLGNWVRDIERVMEKCKEFSTVSKSASTPGKRRGRASFFLSQVIICSPNPEVKVALLKSSIWVNKAYAK